MNTLLTWVWQPRILKVKTFLGRSVPSFLTYGSFPNEGYQELQTSFTHIKRVLVNLDEWKMRMHAILFKHDGYAPHFYCIFTHDFTTHVMIFLWMCFILRLYQEVLIINAQTMAHKPIHKQFTHPRTVTFESRGRGLLQKSANSR